MNDKPNITGIYEIRNTYNNKVYIGSAYNIWRRWAVHKSNLAKGIHENEHLQRSYNKHGPKAFTYSVLEECQKDVLESREQYHILQHFGSMCYNMNNSVECRHMNNRHIKQYYIVSPNDEIIEIYGTIVDISNIVKKSGISTKLNTIQRMLGDVISKKRLHYKGWRLEENFNLNWENINLTRTNYTGKTYNISIIGPDGTLYENITNLSKFSRSQGLPSSALHSVIGKHTKYYKGWRLPGEEKYERNAKLYDIILESPEGIRYEKILNLTKFAKEHGLSQGGLRQFVIGNLKTYKDWKLIKKENEMETIK